MHAHEKNNPIIYSLVNIYRETKYKSFLSILAIFIFLLLQAAQLSIFNGKIRGVAPPQGIALRMHY